MKPSALLWVLFLGLGFAIGWFARGPRDASSQPQPNAVAGAKKGSGFSAAGSAPKSVAKRQSRGQSERSLAESVKKSMDAEDDPEATAHMEKMMDSMAKSQRLQVDQHLQRISQSVSLAEEQRRRLDEWLDEKTEGVRSFDMFSASSAKTEAEIIDPTMNMLSKDGLEAFLGEILTEDQRSDFEEFRERERAAKADSLALKNLSKIQQVVEFTGDQRDQVYEILLRDATERAGKQSGIEKMTTSMHEGMGLEMDPYDLGMDTIMNELDWSDIGEDGSLPESEKMAERLKEEFAKRVDQKVDLLKPVLTSQQLEQYRAELTARGGGFLNQMILGLEMVDDIDVDELHLDDVEKAIESRPPDE